MSCTESDSPLRSCCANCRDLGTCGSMECLSGRSPRWSTTPMPFFKRTRACWRTASDDTRLSHDCLKKSLYTSFRMEQVSPCRDHSTETRDCNPRCQILTAVTMEVGCDDGELRVRTQVETFEIALIYVDQINTYCPSGCIHCSVCHTCSGHTAM